MRMSLSFGIEIRSNVFLTAFISTPISFTMLIIKTMKKSSLFFIAALFVLLFTQVVFGQVTMYVDCNYQGQSRTFDVGRYNWNQLILPNDELSSLKVPAGFSVKLYEHGDFAGRSIIVAGDAACLHDQGFGDVMSSFEVSRTIASGGTTVTMYTDCEYQGDSRSFGVGRYNWNQLGLPNDEISSLRVPAGFTIKLYREADFIGESFILTGDISCLAAQNFNDVVSSFEVFNGPISTIRLEDMSEWLCPKAVLRGDREFDGHGPKIKCNVNLRIGDGGSALYADIYFWAKETVHDWSETERRWSKKVYEAPLGKRITQIVSDRASRTQFISPAAGFQFLVPGSDVASTVNSFLDGVGGTITSTLLASYGINPNDFMTFSRLITGAINNGNTVVRVPSVEGTLVKFFHIVGDTGGPDISDDDNCNDDTRIVKLEFNQVQVIMR